MKSSFLILVFIIGLYSCSNSQNKNPSVNDSNIKLAIQSAEEWLRLIDSKRYEESWEMSAQIFKSTLSKKKWGETLKGLQLSLGKVIKREIKSKNYETSLPGTSDGEYVVIIYETKFEKKENLFETITPMKDEDGIWRVSGYYIK